MCGRRRQAQERILLLGRRREVGVVHGGQRERERERDDEMMNEPTSLSYWGEGDVRELGRRKTSSGRSPFGLL